MEHYLEKVLDWTTEEIADTYDELPYWSSFFGNLLLKEIPIKPYEKILDIGCGTGFPLLKLAEMFGPQSKVYGIDPWSAAVKRLKKRIITRGYENVEIIEADASKIDFPDSTIDLITSNVGINNFENPPIVMNECFRILKSNGHLCLTSNLVGTFDQFYQIFQKTIEELEMNDYLHKLITHINHRATVSSIIQLIENSGFSVVKKIEDTFNLRFLNGTAFLNSSNIILGFIDPWRNMFPEEIKHHFFDRLEKNLNQYSIDKGELSLTIPMVYFDCIKCL